MIDESDILENTKDRADTANIEDEKVIREILEKLPDPKGRLGWEIYPTHIKLFIKPRYDIYGVPHGQLAVNVPRKKELQKLIKNLKKP